MANRDRELLVKLVIDNPWSWSTEGLDDCCAFCDSDDRDWSSNRVPQHEYRHETNCVWLEAREYLGMSQPGHIRKT